VLSTLVQDLRFAVRTLGKRPGFLAITVTTLGLGIGAATAIFSVVDGVLLRPLPYPDPSRLVSVGITWGNRLQPTLASVPDFMDWRERIATLESLAAAQPTSLVLTDGGEPERVRAAATSPELFAALGVRPRLGHPFPSAAYRSGTEALAILSHEIWQRRWGGDPRVIGKCFSGSEEQSAGRASYRVVGVMPPAFRGPEAMDLEDVDLWLPLPLDAAAYAQDRSHYRLRVVGRLKPGVSLEVARQEIDALAAARAAEYPELTAAGDYSLGIGIVSLMKKTVGETHRELMILLGATGLLLLIGCANVAHLLLARASVREREVVLRAALGAGRGRIVRQLLTESLLLALLGAALGVVLASAGVGGFQVLGPREFPRLATVGIDLRAVAFATVVAVVTGGFFGLAPALMSARRDLSSTLREGMAALGGGRRHRLRYGLVVTETALALVLAIAAGLLVRSFLRLERVDPGIEAEGLLTLEVRLGPGYGTNAERAAFFRRLVERVSAIPGVERASSIVDLPIGGLSWAPNVRTEPAGTPLMTPAHLVGPDYFATMGIRVLRGRAFTPRDDADHPPVAVVNETLARRLWPAADPVGQRIKLSADPQSPWITIVGVVNDIHQASLASPTHREFYLPYAQNAWIGRTHLVVRTQAPAGQMAGPLRQALWELDPNLPFGGVVAMRDRIAASLHLPRFRMLLMGSFAGMALLLAATGLYGTLLYLVGQRTRELAIRIALGARRSNVLRLVIGQGMGLTLIGIAIGLGGAFAASRSLARFVFGVTTTDPETFVAVSATLAAVALVSCLIPALRATRIDPMAILRNE